MKHIIQFTILLTAALLAAGCKQNTRQAEPQQQQHPQMVFGGFTDTVELELVPSSAAQTRESAQARSTRTSQKTQSAPAPQAKASSKQTETIYVETDGAQGRVWGHVTMRGDRGTGTIHDWDENTLAVSVTRHGNELYAIDQNSRQYVFKLKK